MKRNILMLASENDALPGGKVGGIGDVVRDAPAALAQEGCEVTVVTPAYGRFARLPGAELLHRLQVPFAGGSHTVGLYSLPPAVDGVALRVLDHPVFELSGQRHGGIIYHDDGPEAPFATDAARFALFCAAAATALSDGKLAVPDVIHLHDWHCGLFFALREFDPRFAGLKDMRCVFSIHNLALQGVRPFDGHPSSLRSWFPDLKVRPATLADPRWPDCINPMACAIRLADKVHAVSPTYAREILLPNAVGERGFHGGEGLEADLQQADEDGRLTGILNGCAYPPPIPVAKSWPALLNLARDKVLGWAGMTPDVPSAHFIAQARLARLTRRRPGVLLTSVGRLSDQKAALFRHTTSSGVSALEAVLEHIGATGLLVLLGTGTTELESFVTEVAGRHRNLVFLRGYSSDLADALYAEGDLFLMPSLFEPCGISQMMAMRAGQPCVVHAVGGLQDTVRDGETGFAFSGTSLRMQADRFVETTVRALALRRDDPTAWRAVCTAAGKERFGWRRAARAYLEELYV